MVTVPEDVMSRYLRDLIVFAKREDTFIVHDEKMQQRVRSLAGMLYRQDINVVVIAEGIENFEHR